LFKKSQQEIVIDECCTAGYIGYIRVLINKLYYVLIIFSFLH